MKNSPQLYQLSNFNVFCYSQHRRQETAELLQEKLSGTVLKPQGEHLSPKMSTELLRASQTTVQRTIFPSVFLQSVYSFYYHDPLTENTTKRGNSSAFQNTRQYYQSLVFFLYLFLFSPISLILKAISGFQQHICIYVSYL